MKPDDRMRRAGEVSVQPAAAGEGGLPWLHLMARQGGPVVAVALLLGLFLIFRAETPDSASTTGQVQVGSDAGHIQVYFTAPQAGVVARPSRGPDTALVEAIDRAQRSVDVAVYALNLESVADALRRADQRGVRIRLVVESDNASEPEVQALLGEGVPVREDQRPALMHHKFVVIDGAEVWTGSMNLTVGAAYHDDNNLVRITSLGLAQDFTREFEEMFEEDRFGALSLSDTPRGRLTVDDTPMEILFSPDDSVAGRIMELIDGAETSLEFAAFSLTADSIADRMLAASARGVRLRGVMEASQSKGIGSEYENLRAAGLDIRLDGNPFNMHHKFLIIDHEIVVTGSYNFTNSAEERNDENVLVLYDGEIAGAYGAEFERIFDMASPPR
jgi:phosphatidylserine/phosphatidylglycerophosphate/cardiolipin synthase-like enzyme